jgi:spore germination cell wall hydrolase CwlJ-like protein
MICELTLGALLATASLYDRPPCSAVPSNPVVAAAIPAKVVMPLAIKASQAERDMVIRTVWGEAGNEPVKGQIAVVAVIRNRVLAGDVYGGPSVTGVVRKPYAFEPWLHARTRAAMMRLAKTGAEYQRIAGLVDGVLDGRTPDPTGGATHFYAPVAQRLLGRRAPTWGLGKPMAVIGGHHFFRPRYQVASAQ